MRPTGYNKKLFCKEKKLSDGKCLADKKEEESGRSVLCFTFSKSSKSFDNDFRVENFYCA